MEMRLENINDIKLVGKSKIMSLSNDKTRELWQSFMPRRALVNNRVDDMLYSMQVYKEKFNYAEVDFEAVFVKWAVAEVNDIVDIPDGMESYLLSGGIYAVFTHIGPASAFLKSFKYIFEEWLPKSEYVLDHREQFEKFSETYNPIDPNATEEIWIPIKLKSVRNEI